MKTNSLLLIPLFFVAGCSTLPPPHYAQPNPVSSVRFCGTTGQAFEIAHTALIANGISPRAGSPTLGYVSGEHGASAFSWGEIVAVYFREENPGDILLWVVNPASLATLLTNTSMIA